MKLFASDLDGTLIPLESDVRYLDAIGELNGELLNSAADVAYVTGRRLELTLDAIKTYKLPKPSFLITDVGTTLYRENNGQWVQDSDYQQQLNMRWKNLSGSEIASYVPVMDGLSPQEDICQSQFKRSYYLEAAQDIAVTREHISKALADAGIQSQIICSVDPLKSVGLIDILPAGASKRSALEFLIKSEGLEKTETVFAGDSGNDLDVFISGLASILVSNTPERIQQEALRVAESEGFKEQLYVARKKYAEGVLEGWQYFTKKNR